MILPEIDYETHPYYAGLGDGLSKERVARVKANYRNALAMVKSSIGGNLDRTLASDTRDASQLSDLGRALHDNGLAIFDLDEASNSTIFDIFRAVLDRLGDEDRETLQIEIDPDQPDGGVGQFGVACVQMINHFDLLAIARSQLNSDDIYIKASARYSTAKNQAFQRNLFAGLPDPRTVGQHFDVPSNSMKITIFLSETRTLETGAFGYIPGSHRRPIEASIQRIANDVLCGQDWVDPRRDIMALPNEFRQRANFGGDLVPGSDQENQLLALEKLIPAVPGRCILFDTLGVHRGGMVSQGTRRAIQVGFFDRSWSLDRV